MSKQKKLDRDDLIEFLGYFSIARPGMYNPSQWHIELAVDEFMEKRSIDNFLDAEKQLGWRG